MVRYLNYMPEEDVSKLVEDLVKIRGRICRRLPQGVYETEKYFYRKYHEKKKL